MRLDPYTGKPYVLWTAWARHNTKTRRWEALAVRNCYDGVSVTVGDASTEQDARWIAERKCEEWNKCKQKP